MAATISAKEVAKHNTKKSCWVVIRGQVWDVTDFLDEHPGGVGLILKCAGKDATGPYEEVHPADLVKTTLSSHSCLGAIDDVSLLSPARGAASSASKTPASSDNYPPLNTILNAGHFEKIAKQYLSDAGWAYYSSGAEDEISIDDARRIFSMITMRPRILRRVDQISTDTSILGCHSSLPLYLSPTGVGKYAHKDAESILSRVAGEEGLIYCMPTNAPYEAVFGARSRSDQKLFFQLYTGRDPQRTKILLQKMERLGAAAIFLTVDSPVIGKRERDDSIKAAEGEDTISATAGGEAKKSSMGLLNPALCWDDLRWIRRTTKLPLVLKGVQTVEDALLAHQHGADGIVLSNHGGRSLDTAQAPILTLLEIQRHAPHLLSPPIRNSFAVLLDGGIRRGNDILKAVALGATAVGIGRPTLYSMCAGYADDGLRRLLKILRAEMRTNMAMLGATCLEELVPEMINTERAETEVSRRIKL